MDKLKYIFTLVILFNLTFEVFGCSGKKKCQWSVCSTSYESYKPQPSPGTCIKQSSKATRRYNTYTKDSGCPASKQCSGGDRVRHYCSCRQIAQCWWGEWGEWTGTIPRNQCGTQRRYRMGQKRYTYSGQVGSCQGVVTKCPRDSDSVTRKWCNCRKANGCTPGSWTSWSPVLSPGKCTQQKRHQDKIPKYTYHGKENSCFGINPSCRSRITDGRTLCSCPYKQCIEGPWTSWEIHTWTGKCPTERRLKRYRSIDRYKSSYGTCQGIGPSTCPNPTGSIREKEITCPKLSPPPDGYHKDAACDGANSKCQAICQIECKAGFNLQGNRYVTCTGHGKWSAALGSCRDAQAPKITCPIVSSYNNTVNKNYAVIDLPDATATDNTRTLPTITMSHVTPLKVYVGKPAHVIYTATDDAGNKKACYVNIEVKDVEAPKIMSCPQDKIFRTGKIPHQVFWGEPSFHDNTDGKYVDTYPSHKNGDLFSRGKHTITYLARDKAFNHIKCIFTIQVELMQCPIFDAPKFGSSTCNIRKDGVVETHICTVSCQKDKWFMKGDSIPTLYNYYVCGENGQWRGQNVFDPTSTTFFVPIETGKTPWPDCTDGKPPDGVTMDFQIFGGSCKNEDEIQKLKQTFINAIKNDMIINNLYCVTSTKNCVLENLIVDCNSQLFYSGYNSNTVVIRFSLALREKPHPNSNDAAELIKLNALAKSFTTQKLLLKAKVQKLAPSLLKDTSTTVYANNAQVGCEPGYEYGFINSTTKDHKKCLECPRGTYYDSRTKRCEVCKVGFYQENEASTSCKKCPVGTSTSGLLAHDFHQCRDICQPGTYSSTGIASCIACPVSTYQPFVRSTSCIKCPPGKVTKDVGATLVNECSEPGVEIKIQSEGCNDPGIKNICGFTTIVVNGKDLSLHKRGMNFVVLDYKTGKHLKSETFDWHEDFQSCSKTTYFLQGLPSEVIILAAVQDEATTNAWHSCQQALVYIGGKRPFQTEYRSSFILVGYKGQQKVSWLQQKKSDFGKGPTVLETSIELLKTK